MITTVTATIYGLCVVVRDKETKPKYYYVVGVKKSWHRLEVWVAGLSHDPINSSKILKEKYMFSSRGGAVYRLPKGAEVFLTPPDGLSSINSDEMKPVSLDHLGLDKVKGTPGGRTKGVRGVARLSGAGQVRWVNNLGCYDVGNTTITNVADYFAWGGTYDKNELELSVHLKGNKLGVIGLKKGGAIKIGIGCERKNIYKSKPFEYVYSIARFAPGTWDPKKQPKMCGYRDDNYAGYGKEHITSPSCPPIDGGYLAKRSKKDPALSQEDR